MKLMPILAVMVFFYCSAVWSAPSDSSEEHDEPIVPDEGLSGWHPPHHPPKKEHLIKSKDIRNPNKGYYYEFLTDQGTHVYQEGKLVDNRCYCDGSSCSGKGCSHCSCYGGHCTGGDHCHQDHCKPGASKSLGGKPCIGGVLQREEEHQLTSSGGCSGHECIKQDKVIINPKGGFSYYTPDCYHVEVKYVADFKGFQPQVKVKKIKGCIPHHPPHHPPKKECQSPESKHDSHGNKCTCKNPHHEFDYHGNCCHHTGGIH